MATETANIGQMRKRTLDPQSSVSIQLCTYRSLYTISTTIEKQVSHAIIANAWSSEIYFPEAISCTKKKTRKCTMWYFQIIQKVYVESRRIGKRECKYVLLIWTWFANIIECVRSIYLSFLRHPNHFITIHRA